MYSMHYRHNVHHAYGKMYIMQNRNNIHHWSKLGNSSASRRWRNGSDTLNLDSAWASAELFGLSFGRSSFSEGDAEAEAYIFTNFFKKPMFRSLSEVDQCNSTIFLIADSVEIAEASVKYRSFGRNRSFCLSFWFGSFLKAEASDSAEAQKTRFGVSLAATKGASAKAERDEGGGMQMEWAKTPLRRLTAHTGCFKGDISFLMKMGLHDKQDMRYFNQ